MADGTKVATAYVEVSTKLSKDAKSNITRQLPGEAEGRRSGKGIASGLKAGVAAGAVALGNILSNVATSAASTLSDTFAQAFEGYAAYEQLTGGVEKLFGPEAARIVQENAEKAFSAAGMSANQYMEQATSFSASLISSLGGDTVTAANLADVAMRNMSDNANTFGTDMASIQNAYQGFAKGQFNMLDNLKLGYGGTKEEMQKLLREAERVEGFADGSLSIDSFADIIEAIDIVQEHMNISGLTAEQAAEMVASGALTEEEALKRMGTTAREGSTTVEGSINTMRATWDNWLVALGREDVDMATVTDRLVDSIEAAASNAVPVAGRILERVGYTIAAYAPVLFDNSLVAMSQIAAAAPDAAPQVVAAVVALAMQGAQVLVSSAPQFLAGAIQMLGGILQGIVYSIPGILASLLGMIPQLVQGVAGGAGQMFGAAMLFFDGLSKALLDVGYQLADMIVYVVTHLPEIVMDGVGMMAEAGKAFLDGLVQGFTGGQPEADGAAAQAAKQMADSAAQAADGTAVAEQYSDSLMASFDMSQFEAKATADTQAAIDAAALTADAAPISDHLSTTAASGIDTASMEPKATEMVENAVKAAQSVDSAAIGEKFSQGAAGGIDTSAMADAIASTSAATAQLSQTATVKVQADLSGVQQLQSAAGTVQSAYASVASSIASSMRTASAAASSAAASINRTLAGLPKSQSVKLNVTRGSIELPHISVSGKYDMKAGTAPAFSVSWWKEGGIFDRPTIFANGVGEAGPEAVLPLSRLSGMLDESNRKYAGGTTNIYVEGIQASPESELYRLLQAVVEEAKVAERRKAVHR